jgi:Rieske Fe-S protein
VTDGGVVHAEHAVVATHAPIVDPRYLTTRCRPHRSYVLAAQIDGQVPSGMYLSVDEPVRSLRPATVDGTTYLVVCGEGHPAGDERDARTYLDALERWARRHFAVRSVDHRWAAHDQMPADQLPFIGRLAPGSQRWVATGFQKWGLTTSAVAAAIVSDGILGHRHPAADVFDPTRLLSTFTGRLAADVGRVASRYTGDHVRVALRARGSRADRLANLEPGGGIVLPEGRGGIAVHRSADGQLHGVSAVCTHEGCFVRFNRAQASWDCPCHGSRFAVDGTVLCGPAVEDLSVVELEAVPVAVEGAEADVAPDEVEDA